MDKLFQPVAILLLVALDQGRYFDSKSKYYLTECAGWSYPGGAPGCGLTPGHGEEAQSVNATLQYLGGLIWQVEPRPVNKISHLTSYFIDQPGRGVQRNNYQHRSQR